MKIQNNTKTTYIHDDLKLLPNGEVTEVKDEKIAKVWLTIDGIVEYVAPEDVKAEKEALEAEIEKLKKENAELKKETAPKAEKTTKSTKTTKKGK
jgi:hypothetical protein